MGFRLALAAALAIVRIDRRLCDCHKSGDWFSAATNNDLLALDCTVD